MVRYEPPGLERKWKEAVEVLRPIVGTIEFLNFEEIYADDSEGIVVTPESTIAEFALQSWGETIRVTVEDCLRLSELIQKKPSPLYRRMVLRLQGKTLIHIATNDLGSQRQIELLLASRHRVETACRSGKVWVRLQPSSLEFAAAIEAEGENDSTLPSDHFEAGLVEVTHPLDASADDVDAILQAFLFELCCADIFAVPRPFPGGITDDIDDAELVENTVREGNLPKLRSLNHGHGMKELHSLFTEGTHAVPAQFALIHFVKVIEYVSATVVRMTQHEALRKRLSTSKVFHPDAAFLDSITTLVNENKVYTKDSEALKLTVQKCCDAVLLAAVECPAFLTKLRFHGLVEDEKAQRAALEQFAIALSATRNQLSHAKANYELTGFECPDEQLPEFTVLARTAAEQAIRWFGNLPEHARVCD